MTTVTTRGARVFEICALCDHWTKRYVDGCSCCHGDKPEGEE